LLKKQNRRGIFIMQIRLKRNGVKDVVEIDPVLRNNREVFAPLIVVAVYHIGLTEGSTVPRVLSTFAGQLDAKDAAMYAEGLSLAAFLAERAEEMGSLVGAYKEVRDLDVVNMSDLNAHIVNERRLAAV
jgi:hypothetical protein